MSIPIYYLGPARLSCSGNINSVQTKTIPTTITPMMTILDLIFDFHIQLAYPASITTILSSVYEKSVRKVKTNYFLIGIFFGFGLGCLYCIIIGRIRFSLILSNSYSVLQLFLESQVGTSCRIQIEPKGIDTA